MGNIKEKALIIQNRMAVEAKLLEFKYADLLTEEQSKQKRGLEGELANLKRREEELSRPSGFEVKEKIVIESLSDISKAIEMVKKLPLSPKHTITIRPGGRVRSIEQNRLLWKWNAEIGEQHLGYTAEEIHEEFKKMFLVRIFYRDDDEYAALGELVRDGKNHMCYEVARKQLIRMTSTTKCSTKQMAEYLGKIKQFALSNDIPITIPKDKDLEWLLS